MEGGVYLHGVPYAIAPQEQTRVPFMLWMPGRSAKNLKLNTTCLSASFARENEHDVLAHTLLGLYGVRTRIYRQEFDLLSGCRAQH